MPQDNAKIVHAFVIRRPLKGSPIKADLAAHSAVLLIDENGKALIAGRLGSPHESEFCDVSYEVIETNCKRKYENIVTDDGQMWSKQLIGKEVPRIVTKDQVKEFMVALSHATVYDVRTSNCHHAQEELRRWLGLEIPAPRPLTAFTTMFTPSTRDYTHQPPGVSLGLKALPHLAGDGTNSVPSAHIGVSQGHSVLAGRNSITQQLDFAYLDLAHYTSVQAAQGHTEIPKRDPALSGLSYLDLSLDTSARRNLLNSSANPVLNPDSSYPTPRFAPGHTKMVAGAISDLKKGPWDEGRVARVIGATAAGAGLYVATGGAVLACPTATGVAVGVSMALGPAGLVVAGICAALGIFCN